MESFKVASIILVSTEGKLLFQERDDKPGIRNPGKITAWGGACENEETPLQAAVREMREETNLRPTEADFTFLKEYPRNDYIDGRQVVNYVYILNKVSEENLKVYEGQGFVSMSATDSTANPLYTDLTIEIIRDYKRLLFYKGE